MVNDVQFTFDVSGVAETFKVESFRVTEALSTLFEMTLTVLSENDKILFDSLSRKVGVLRLQGRGADISR